MRSRQHGVRRHRQARRPLCLAVAAALAGAAPLGAQENQKQGAEQAEALRELLRRNDELEARVQRLEQQAEERAAADAEAAAEPLFGIDDEYGIVFRYGEVTASMELFGDVGLSYENPEDPGAHSSFFLGDVSLFVNAQIGDRFRLLSETVLHGESDDDFDVTQERLWGSWQLSDLLYVKLGTEHSRISRWNQLYHHGKYLEPTITRPLLARFEGSDGILPLHNTGVEVGGTAYPELGTFEYWAAVSNGRGPDPSDKQRVDDANDGKRLDAGLALSPTAVEDLRLGASFTFDTIPPDGGSTDPERALSIRELIEAANVEYRAGPWGFLGEMALIQHRARSSGRRDDSHSAYLQVTLDAGEWTPYTRFDYRNMSEGDPYFAPSGRDLDAWRQVFGVRWDIVERAAIKIELGVGRQEGRDGVAITEDTAFDVGVQLSWGL